MCVNHQMCCKEANKDFGTGYVPYKMGIVYTEAGKSDSDYVQLFSQVSDHLHNVQLLRTGTFIIVFGIIIKI